MGAAVVIDAKARDVLTASRNGVTWTVRDLRNAACAIVTRSNCADATPEQISTGAKAARLVGKCDALSMMHDHLAHDLLRVSEQLSKLMEGK